MFIPGLLSPTLVRRLWHTVPLCLLVFSTSGQVQAQSTAEYAGATSASAGVSAKKYTAEISIAPTTEVQPQSKSPHLPLREGPLPEFANRRALQERAGKDAAKLLLRSEPSGAQVWIDGGFVGNSPMLLLLAPGKYRIVMRGQRQEFAERVVGLLPRETRELVLPLTLRYPTRFSLR